MSDDSAIGRVVQAFARSLDLAEEGGLHAAEAAHKTLDAFSFCRSAFADSEAVLVRDASSCMEEALSFIHEAESALAQAKQEIRNFSRLIAPGLTLVDSQEDRSSPAGEQLADTSRRPRNLREVASTMVREAENGAEIANSTVEVFEGFLELLQPPDPGGLSTVAQRPATAVSQPSTPVAADGNPILTGALVAATAVKGVQVAMNRFRRFLRGG